jgi:hypothetical protein
MKLPSRLLHLSLLAMLPIGAEIFLHTKVAKAYCCDNPPTNCQCGYQDCCCSPCNSCGCGGCYDWCDENPEEAGCY